MATPDHVKVPDGTELEVTVQLSEIWVAPSVCAVCIAAVRSVNAVEFASTSRM